MNVHIAIPTKDIQASKAFYERLGFSVAKEYAKPGDQLQIIRMSHQGQYILELMAHAAAQDFSYAHRPELLHIGVIVENIESTLEQLQRSGAKLLKPITAGAAVKRFAFVADPSGYPVELVEE
ncbi:MAG: VOC family protein [Candidatus Kerfeldbacteria bacterium]|nr:VOC family protein [Candidatus Kerfeldbacteria bacterium]